MKIHGFFASQNRPLAGIMVLNGPPYGWHNDAIENGVCGAESHVKPLRHFLLYHFLYFYTLYRHRI